MSDILIKAVVTREDGSALYREEHEFSNLTPEQDTTISAALDKHIQFLKQLEKDQKKKADEDLTAVFSRTGKPDETFTGFTLDEFGKAMHAWSKLGDDMVKALEHSLKKA